ncbi:MAG: patatin-like phospholipase family protein [Gemmatimonadota bacterium]
MTTLEARLSLPGPKRLLALDGGGIRGLVTLGYLERIESLLREQHGAPDLVLADYFDLIGGTSTGSVIATALALGWPVGEIRRLYHKLGADAFKPKRSLLGPFGRIVGAKFDEKAVGEVLRSELHDWRLDSERLRVGLTIIAKRADTGSVWVLVNIPGHRYYEMNRHLKLWEVVRASTAAPTYFAPQWIKDLGGGEGGVFVDGAVSMHGDPALQLLMVATLQGFGLGWPLGAERILLCSVGTGSFVAKAPPQKLKKYTQLHWLALLMVQMMSDAGELNRTMLQWLSRSPTAHEIDSQIGDLGSDLLGPQPLLHYLRYNVGLDPDALSGLGLTYSEKEASSLREMTNVAKIPELDEVGQRAAAAQVHLDHFPDRFKRDVP